MYQEIQYRLYINKSQIEQFRYHNGSLDIGITMVVSHLSNKKMFLGGDPCRNKYAVYKQKT